MYQGLLDYCVTDRQTEVIKALQGSESQAKAAKSLGVSVRTIAKTLARIRKQATEKGYAPDHGMSYGTPHGLGFKGASVYHQATDTTPAQWVKYKAGSEDNAELIKEVVDALKTDVRRVDRIKQPKKTSEKLLNLYVLTDIHIGMKAWHKEGGADWDLKIVEDEIYKAFDHMISSSPDAEVGYFCQLGDGLHSDGMLPMTPTSHHVLDQDGRFAKIVEVAIRIFRDVVAALLEKHKKVVVLMAQGNHDLASSLWLQEVMAVAFEKNPRVEVVKSPLPYYAYQHGQTLLAFHHGHKATMKRLPEIIAAEFREMVGKTKRTYIHTGHKHHRQVIETSMATVEQHETLAARDAYASHGGWHAGRSTSCITYNDKGGVHSSVTYNIEG